MSDQKITPIDSVAQSTNPQITRGKQILGDPPAILPVVEMITHRFLGGADIPYLTKKYPGMGRERVEDCIRYGCLRMFRERKAAA